jgi:hypothetical protein
LGQKETVWEKFMEQFQNPLILLLFGSAFVSALVGQYDDAISIVLTIIIVMTGTKFSCSCICSRVSIDAVSRSIEQIGSSYVPLRPVPLHSLEMDIRPKF